MTKQKNKGDIYLTREFDTARDLNPGWQNCTPFEIAWYFWRAALQSSRGNTEWEYGVTYVYPGRPSSVRGTLAEARESQEFYNQTGTHPSKIFKRTKETPVGPWIPVEGETND